MAKFYEGTLAFCNIACSTRFVNENQPETCWNPGLQVRFTRPFQEREGETCGQIETSKGTIYYRILIRSVDNDYYRKKEYGSYFGNNSGKYQSEIEHFSINDIWCVKYDPANGKVITYAQPVKGVGILLQSIPRTVVPTDKIVADLGKDLIFKSDPFFSGYHFERGDNKSLEFFVFDAKENANEVQAGV